ncbi:hypothetical protein ACQ4LE_009587 [Meloidogyne hapla]
MNPNFLHFSTTMNIELYSHLLRNVFKIVNFDTFKYTNVLDFPVDSPSKNLPQSSSKSNVGQQAALDTSTPFNLDKPIEKLNEIFKIYERFRKVSSFGELLQSVVPDPNEIITQIDNFENMPDANVLLYRECLDLIFRGGHQNVILSYNTIKATIAGALGRLLLYRMAEYVRGDDVFCIEKNNSEAFQQVTNKFQKESIIIVTRNLETKQLAVEAGLPCWFIRSNEDLVLFLEEIKLLVSQIQTLTGTPYKKRCEFCQEEIEQHLYLKQLRCLQKSA